MSATNPIASPTIRPLKILPVRYDIYARVCNSRGVNPNSQSYSEYAIIVNGPSIKLRDFLDRFQKKEPEHTVIHLGREIHYAKHQKINSERESIRERMHQDDNRICFGMSLCPNEKEGGNQTYLDFHSPDKSRVQILKGRLSPNLLDAMLTIGNVLGARYTQGTWGRIIRPYESDLQVILKEYPQFERT